MQFRILRLLALISATMGVVLLLAHQMYHHSSTLFGPLKYRRERKEYDQTHKVIRLKLETGMMHRTPLYQRSASCECRSLFTVGSCGFEEIRSIRLNDHVWEGALSSLEEIQKYDGNKSYVDALKTLSSYLPQEFHLNLDWRTNTTLGSINNADEALPFVKCSERIYTPEDLKFCFRKLKDEVGKTLSIIFLGDSRTRFLMREFFKTIEKSLLVDSMTRKKLNRLYNTKIQHRWTIKLQTIEAQFIWAPYLDEQGDNKASVPMMEICSKTNRNLPDILVISYAAWPALFRKNIEAFNDYFDDLKKYRSCIKSLAEKIVVVWMLPPPMKISNTIADGIANPILDLANSIAWHLFRNTKVILWDTREIVSIKETEECYKLINRGLLDVTPKTWHCWDLHHPGTWTNGRSVQMLLNLVCGSAGADRVDLCCP